MESVRAKKDGGGKIIRSVTPFPLLCPSAESFDSMHLLKRWSLARALSLIVDLSCTLSRSRVCVPEKRDYSLARSHGGRDVFVLGCGLSVRS